MPSKKKRVPAAKAGAAASLELVAEKAVLVGVVDSAARVASSVADAQILTCARLQLSGNRLTVTGTDTEVFSTSRVEVDGRSNGSVAVPARPLADLLRACPGDSVSLSITDGRLRIASGPFVAAMVTAPESEFPKAPKVDAEAISYDAEQFAATAHRVAATAAKDKARPLMTGVCFEPGQRLTLAATDSYRLSRGVVEGSGPDSQYVISAHVLSEVLHAMSRSKAETVEVAYGEQVRFVTGDTELVTRSIEGAFPDYAKLFPSAYAVTINVDRKALLEAIGRSRLLLRGVVNSPVRLVLGAESITMLAGGEMTGDATEALEATVVGDPISVAFNAGFLADALRHGDGEEVELSLVDPLKPAVVSFPAIAEYETLLMPVKTHDDSRAVSTDETEKVDNDQSALDPELAGDTDEPESDEEEPEAEAEAV